MWATSERWEARNGEKQRADEETGTEIETERTQEESATSAEKMLRLNDAWSQDIKSVLSMHSDRPTDTTQWKKMFVVAHANRTLHIYGLNEVRIKWVAAV